MSKYAFFNAKQCGLPETESQQGRIFDETCWVLLYTRVLRRARKPSRVAGTRNCGAGAGNRRYMRAGASAGRPRDKNFLSGLLNIDPMRVKQACARTSMLQRACGTRVTQNSPVVARTQIAVSSFQ